MSASDRHGFSAEKVFLWLIIFTAAEVAWGVFGHGMSRPLLWGGLIACAVLKGFLIASYFMHLRFEGWIVKCLIAPTPILVLVIVFGLMPDVGCHSPKLVNPVGSYMDRTTGQIVDMHAGPQTPAGHAAPPADGAGATPAVPAGSGTSGH